MIPYRHRVLLLEVVGWWCTAGVMHDNRGLTTLNNMYWYGVRAAECEDLGFSAPYGGIPNVRTIARILPRTNDPRVARTSAIFPLDARKERTKVLGVCLHVFGRGSASLEGMRLLWWDDVEGVKLV